MTTNKEILDEVKQGRSEINGRLDLMNGQVRKNTKFRYQVMGIAAAITVGVPLAIIVWDSVRAGQ